MAIKYILGIQSIASHDTGASIVRLDTIDNSIKYVCISEERLIRKKYPYTFPIHSIDYCMDYFKIKNLNRIDLVISDWNKVKKWQRTCHPLHAKPRGDGRRHAIFKVGEEGKVKNLHKLR